MRPVDPRTVTARAERAEPGSAMNTVPFTVLPGSNRLSLARIRWEYRRSIVAADLADGYSEKG